MERELRLTSLYPVEFISVTFAPEAGSQRLRNVINKDITEEEILRAAESAFDHGYSAVKLYFMMGLPTERDEDPTRADGAVNESRLTKPAAAVASAHNFYVRGWRCRL